MICEECNVEMDAGYGMAGGGIGPYFICPKCDKFVKFQDPEMLDDDLPPPAE